MNRTYDQEARALFAKLFRNAAKAVEEGLVHDPDDLGQCCAAIRYFCLRIAQLHDSEDVSEWFDQNLNAFETNALSERLVRKTGSKPLELDDELPKTLEERLADMKKEREAFEAAQTATKTT